MVVLSGHAPGYFLQIGFVDPARAAEFVLWIPSMDTKNVEREATCAAQVRMPPATTRLSQTAQESTAQKSTAVPSTGTIPSELIRLLCLATVVVSAIYWLPLIQIAVGWILIVSSGWIVVRALGGLRSHVLSIFISIGLLAILFATQNLLSPPPQHVLAETCRYAVQIHVGMLVMLILADGLDLAFSGRGQFNPTRLSRNLPTRGPADGEVHR